MTEQTLSTPSPATPSPLTLRWGPHLLALLLAVMTLFLLIAGAAVTSTGSGLAVPDWPLAFGQWFPEMTGGVFYEHGHRMVATGVGFLTVALAIWLAVVEPRPWVRMLGMLAVISVIVQGVLGGITVLYLLPKPVSISHATLAQLFFVLTLVLAQVTSPAWPHYTARRGQGGPGRTVFWSGWSLAAILLTLILGATMRHHFAGLAIPDWPLNWGRIVPPLDTFPVAIHYAHRVAAYVTFALVLVTHIQTMRAHKGQPWLIRPALLVILLVTLQIALGVMVIWSTKSVHSTVVHLANGGLLFGTMAILHLRARVLEARA